MVKIFIFFISFTYAQSIDVTFRYVETPSDNFLRVFVPGTMPTGSNNDWGPNSNGFISPDAPSQMIYNEATDSYEKSYNLDVNEQYLYKIHFHHNSSGTNNSWISDPLNPEVTDDEWNNSILNVTDPLFFQPARHMNENNYVDGFSIGIFSSSTVDSILYCIGDDTLNGTSYYQENGIFHLPFKRISNRIKRFHNEFEKLKITKKLERKKDLKTWKYKPLYESKRIASIVKKRIIKESL